MVEDDYFLPFTTYTFYSKNNESVYKNILASTELSFEQQGVELIRAAILSCSGEAVSRFAHASKWKSIKDLQEDLKETVKREDVLFWGADEKVKPTDEIQVSSRIKVVINLTETFLTQSFEQIKDSIMGLVAFYKNVEFIQFKFVMEQYLWRKYQEDFVGLKASTFELNILPEDIQFIVYANLNQNLFMPYLKMIRTNDNYREYNRWYKVDGRTITDVQLLEALELLLGIRKDVKTYSVSVCDYVYSFFNSDKQICYTKLLDAIQLAVQLELEDTATISADDRLISFEHLKYALESLKE